MTKLPFSGWFSNFSFKIFDDDLSKILKNPENSKNIKTGLRTGNFCNENDQKITN